jgi:HAD superfamily hydrolase (TIGR01509 family)
MYTAALFDLDDTLFDHKHARRCALRRLAEDFPRLNAFPIERVEAIHEQHLVTTHERLLDGTLSQDDARAERLISFLADFTILIDRSMAEKVDVGYRAAYTRSRRPVPGAVELINALRGRMKIGVVTNGLVADQWEKLRVCGLEKAFDAVIISAELGVRKPDPAIFEIALKRLGSTPNKCVVIGDSWKNDVLGARSAGLSAIWINRYAQTCPNPSIATEIKQIRNCETLLHLVESRSQTSVGNEELSIE